MDCGALSLWRPQRYYTFEDLPFWTKEAAARATVPLGRIHHEKLPSLGNAKKIVIQYELFIVVFFFLSLVYNSAHLEAILK